MGQGRHTGFMSPNLPRRQLAQLLCSSQSILRVIIPTLMRAKSGSSVQKFFRRTSRSPWEPPLGDTPTPPAPMPTDVTPSRMGSLHRHPGQPQPPLSHAQSPARTRSINTALNCGEQGAGSGSMKQGEDKTSTTHRRNTEEMKITYIQLNSPKIAEKVTTVCRRASQLPGTGSESRRMQQISYLRHENSKLVQEARVLRQQLKNTNMQNKFLVNQLDNTRNASNAMEQQLRKIKTKLQQCQSELILSELTSSNLKNISDFMKNKYQQKTSELQHRISALELELKTNKLQREDLAVQLQHAQDRFKFPGALADRQAHNTNRIRAVVVHDRFGGAQMKQNTRGESGKKCNRFVQTSVPATGEQYAKQNQRLAQCLKTAHSTIRDLSRDINCARSEIKSRELLQQKHHQLEKLIESLTESILVSKMQMLSQKYRLH